MDTEHLLDLTTQTIQRKHVKIDGESYEVMSIDELSLAETLSFARKKLLR